MSLQEAGFILLTLFFTILSLFSLFLLFFRHRKTQKISKIFLTLFLVFLIFSVVCGYKFYTTYYLCSVCGKKATCDTPFGKYCDDCFEKRIEEEKKHFNTDEWYKVPFAPYP